MRGYGLYAGSHQPLPLHDWALLLTLMPTADASDRVPTIAEDPVFFNEHGLMKKRKAFVTVCISGGAGFAALSLWILWRGFNLIVGESLSISQEAAILQSLGGAAALFATIGLIGVTFWYAWLTMLLVNRSTPTVTAEVLTEWSDKYHQEFFTVVIRNSGNASVSIDKVSVVGGGFRSDHTKSYTDVECPFQLLGNSSQKFQISWMWLDMDIDKFSEVYTSPRDLRALVELGSGQRIETDRIKLHHAPSK